ncbi:hypothetical protein FPV67DRAFT_1559110 [Lyophyllum atratum]|nr:hypothetical protein FPV67DRAFT_1559110 [Lyophyllum atratum]
MSPDPSYISAHSADTILSDIRPIKLKIEALPCFPPTLGKEALLEAEVELRAYWDRTAPADVAVLEDDSKSFHLQWAFELLRLKCEAYSTLNEPDEDHGAEGRINDRMSAKGGTPPKAALMAPAALYLTAILEHILSNVGRVAARDSSRASATVQDLFVALCEDHSIYDLFKTMKVYEQIEQLSKTPKVRRSKSLTRNDKPSRTSSPHQDLSTAKEAPARSRLSSEASGIATNVNPTSVSISGSRSSFEKTRAMKMFKANSRSSIDRDGDVASHKRTDSVVSENSRHTATQVNDDGSIYEVLMVVQDEAMQQEFDNLMRSSATMKVSLTPDRLKTMEVYKQEKDQRGNRRPAPISFKPNLIFLLSHHEQLVVAQSLLRVDSIQEDDEEGLATKPSPTRSRQASITSPPAPKANPPRVRSISTASSGAASRAFAKLSQSSTPSPASIQPKVVNSASMQNPRHFGKGQDPFPPRTRKIQHNRESIDLDDVMGGSDDEDIPAPRTPAKSTSPRRNGQHGVSASTRDLMDFLAQGPPPDTGGPASNFNGNGLHTGNFPFSGNGLHNGNSENGKSKGTGRLQRMISKLSLNSTERSRDDKPPQSVARPIPSQSSLNNLSSLANRPIPPRPPPKSSFTAARVHGVHQSFRAKGRPSPSESPHPDSISIVPGRREHSASISSNHRQTFSHVNGHGPPHRNGTVEHVAPVSGPPRTVNAQAKFDPSSSPVIVEKTKIQSRSHITSPTSPARKPAPVYVESSSKAHLSVNDAHDMHRLLGKATTADECRLIFDMFLAKSGIPVEPTNYDAPYPSPSPSVIVRETPGEAALEHTLVELFLGGQSASNSGSHRSRARKRSKPEVLVTEPSPHSRRQSC